MEERLLSRNERPTTVMAESNLSHKSEGRQWIARATGIRGCA